MPQTNLSFQTAQWSPHSIISFFCLPFLPVPPSLFWAKVGKGRCLRVGQFLSLPGEGSSLFPITQAHPQRDLGFRPFFKGH